MKKICSIVIILALLSCTGAFADKHLGIDCNLTGSSGEKTFSIDFYEQEGRITAVSSMFPDIAISIDNAKNLSAISAIHMFSAVRPEKIMQAELFISEILSNWLESQNSVKTTGVFSGYLFGYATTMQSCEFPLSDFQLYLQQSVRQQGLTAENDTSHQFGLQMLSLFSDQLDIFTKEFDPIACLKSYDDGQYLVLQIIKDSDIYMTISADRTSTSDTRMLVSYKEDGRYCYHDLHYSADYHSISLTSSLSVTEKPVYQSDHQPIISETLTMISETGSDLSFVYRFEPGNLKEPCCVSGTLFSSSDNQAELSAFAYIDGNESGKLNISAYTEKTNRDVLFSDKSIKSLKEPVQINEIRLALYSGMIMLVSHIYPDLPEDYQEFVTGVLLP